MQQLSSRATVGGFRGATVAGVVGFLQYFIPTLKLSDSSRRSMQVADAAHCSTRCSIIQLAQLRRMERDGGLRPWSLTLKAQLGLGHVELSEKYDRHYTRTCGGRVVTVGDLQRHAVGGVQLRLQSWDPMSPHPV